MSTDYGRVERVDIDKLGETDITVYLNAELLGVVGDRAGVPFYNNRHPTDNPEEFTDDEMDALREGVRDLYEEKLDEGDFVAAASIGQIVTGGSVFAEHAYWDRIERAHELHSSAGEDGGADEKAISLLLEAAWVAEYFNLSDHRDPYNTKVRYSHSRGRGARKTGKITEESKYPRRKVLGPIRMAYDIKAQALESGDVENYEALRELEDFRADWDLSGRVSPREGEISVFTGSLSRYGIERDLAREYIQTRIDGNRALKSASRKVQKHSLSDEFGETIIEKHAAKAPKESELDGDHQKFLEDHEKIARRVGRSPLVTADDYVVMKR